MCQNLGILSKCLNFMSYLLILAMKCYLDKVTKFIDFDVIVFCMDGPQIPDQQKTMVPLNKTLPKYYKPRGRDTDIKLLCSKQFRHTEGIVNV